MIWNMLHSIPSHMAVVHRCSPWTNAGDGRGVCDYFARQLVIILEGVGAVLPQLSVSNAVV